MSAILRAISIREPWVWAIRCAHKRVENRDRDTLIHYRGPVLLHTGVTCSRRDFIDEITWMQEQGLVASNHRTRDEAGRPLPVAPPNHLALALGGFGARAVVVGCRRNTKTGHEWAEDGVGAPIHGKPCLRGCGTPYSAHQNFALDKCPKRDRWAAPGAVGIQLDKVEPLPCFVPWAGNLALPFKVDEDEFALLMAAHLARAPLALDDLIARSQPYRTSRTVTLASVNALLDRGALRDEGGRLAPPIYTKDYPVYTA